MTEGIPKEGTGGANGGKRIKGRILGGGSQKTVAKRAELEEEKPL